MLASYSPSENNIKARTFYFGTEIHFFSAVQINSICDLVSHTDSQFLRCLKKELILSSWSPFRAQREACLLHPQQ